MGDNLQWKITFDGRQALLEDYLSLKEDNLKNSNNLNNDDDLKNKEDLYIAGRHAALDMDIFRFAAIF